MTITLLAKGKILDELHYNIYARYWWELRLFDKTSESINSGQASIISIPIWSYWSLSNRVSIYSLSLSV